MHISALPLKIKEDTYEVYMLKTGFFNMINNVYIIIDTKTRQGAIVDPTWDIGLVKDTLYALQVDLTAILLTHSHYDHTNLVNALLKIFPAKVYMSQVEIDYYNYKCNHLIPVQDGDVINIGNTDIDCILTPGHTAGGMCFLLSGSLFTGDTVFVEGCGLCSTRGGSAGDMFESINRIKTTINPEVKIYSSHTIRKLPGCTLGDVMKENFYFQIEKKNHFIQFRERENQKNTCSFS
jgi:glyoxylase-like metal-dependent hydrolase (beta-lactamase superfamily II)